MLGDQGSLSAPPGSASWVRAVYLEACSAVNDATKTREYVETWVGALLEDNHYQRLADEHDRPFMFWSDFCAARQPFGLGYAPDAIEALMAQRPTTAQLAEKAAKDEPLPKHGEVGNGRSRDANSKSTSGGTTVDYLTARIARDRPDVLAAMKRGEYPSVRAAAIAAGIVAERWSVPGNPIQLAAYLCRRLTPGEIDQLVRLLSGRREPEA